MIRGFLSWAYWKESDRWTEANYDERTTVMRHVSQAKILTGFGVFMTGMVYAAFFRGLYNYRTWEVINMRKVPFPLKFGASSLMAGYISYTLWKDDIYNPDVYRLAVKYRMQYDSDFSLKYDGK